MRPKRCTMCPNRARPDSHTCSSVCNTARINKQKSLDRHRARSKVRGSYQVTVEDWMKILRDFDYRCAYCRVTGPMTIDHVVPLSRGGRHAYSNLVPCCAPCNSDKANKTVIEWRKGASKSPIKVLRKRGHSYKKDWKLSADGLITIKTSYRASDAPLFEELRIQYNNSMHSFLVDHFGPLV